MLVETARQVVSLSCPDVERALHPKEDDLGNLKGVFVLKDKGEKSVAIHISMVQNFAHINSLVVS